MAGYSAKPGEDLTLRCVCVLSRHFIIELFAFEQLSRPWRSSLPVLSL